MRILIAEDESIIRMGLKSMLQEMGHEVFADLKLHDIPTTVAGAVTSAGRFSALLVGALGPCLFVYLFLFHTHYIRVMLESPLGQVLLLGAAVLEVIGLMWTARLMKPVY